MIKILNWRKLFSEQNIIFVHLNICSSLVPALADLRRICTLCLQLVAFLEAGFGNEMEISVRYHFWRNCEWEEIETFSPWSPIWTSTWSDCKNPTGLGENRWMSHLSGCMPWTLRSDMKQVQLHVYLVDRVWTIQQLCVVGQDVLKFSCLRSAHE